MEAVGPITDSGVDQGMAFCFRHSCDQLFDSRQWQIEVGIEDGCGEFPFGTRIVINQRDGHRRGGIGFDRYLMGQRCHLLPRRRKIVGIRLPTVRAGTLDKRWNDLIQFGLNHLAQRLRFGKW